MNWTFVFIMSFLFFGLLSASRDQKHFSQAHAWYLKAEYKKAFDSYGLIKQKGSAVWYNMGNCAYHTADYAQAQLCWRRAYRGATLSQVDDIAYNLDLLEHKQNKEQKITWADRADTLFDRIAWSVSWGLWQLIVILLWCSFCFVAKRYKGRRRYGILMVLLISNVIVFIPVVARYRAQKRRIAIVMQPEVAVYAGPDQHYHAVGVARESARVLVCQERGSWCKIKCADTIGWVLSDKIVVV
jgi:tetratricopeptide (TPR) repeat protein